MKKVPFGIIAGACAMLAFFGIVGFIVAYLVYGGIAAQTASSYSITEHWWHVLLLVVDIVAVLGTIGSLVMFIYKKKKYPQTDEEGDDD